MKRLFVLILGIILFASLSYAQAPLFTPTPPKLKAEPQPALATLGTGLPFTLDGDSLYLMKSRVFAGGAGVNLATYKGIVNLRFETAVAGDGSVFTGAGLSLDIAKTLSLIPGVSWSTEGAAFRPSIGVTPGWTSGTGKFDWALTLSILSVSF